MRTLWESKSDLKISPWKRYNIFCTMSSWSENMLMRGFKSFQRGTVDLCRSKGCKVKVHQTLRMILLSKYQTLAAHVRCLVGRVAGFYSSLQLWQLVTLESFDLQRCTVPLRKDLIPIVNMLSAQESDIILNICLVLPQRPHLHRSYLEQLVQYTF